MHTSSIQPISAFHALATALSARAARLIATCLLPALVLAITPDQAHSVGIRLDEVAGNQVAAWYPSDVHPREHQLGDYTIFAAKDARPRAGRYPIVILSQGINGHFADHYLTAETLADHGYIVLATNHASDHRIGGIATVAAIRQRLADLEALLDWAKADDRLARLISDTAPVRGVGHSLGGATIMLAAGATLDVAAADRHCRTHRQADHEFCAYRHGIVVRTLAEIKRLFDSALAFLPKADPAPDHPTLITGKIVLIAPVGQGLDLTHALTAQSVHVLAIHGDTLTPPRFHAQPLAEAITNHILPVGFITIPATHQAFIAPTDATVGAVRTESNPLTFADRLAFIATANAYILSALGYDMTAEFRF